MDNVAIYMGKSIIQESLQTRQSHLQYLSSLQDSNSIFILDLVVQ